MLIHYKHGKFVCERWYSPVHIETLVNAGFTYSPQTDIYYTNYLSNAYKLKEFFTPEAKEHVNKFSLITYSESPFVLHPALLKPRDVQIKAARFALKNNRSYLALQQRLGKTATAIMVHNSIRSQATLVVCPPHAIENWKGSFNMWGLGYLEYLVIDEGVKAPMLEFETLPNFDVCIIPDSLLINDMVMAFIAKMKWDLAVLDEAHKFNQDSKRSQRFYLVKDKFKKLILLSGTPHGGNVYDLWPVIKNLCWNLFDFISEDQFIIKYCGGVFRTEYRNGKQVSFWHPTGSSHEEEFRKRIEPFMLVEKLSDHSELMLEEQVVEFEEETDSILSLDKLFESEIAKGKSVKQISDEYPGGIATYQRVTGKRKSMHHGMLKYIRHHVEAGESVLVIGQHVEALETVNAVLHAFFDSALIRGGVSAKDKEIIRKSFQDGKIKCIVAHSSSMIAIDLSRADRIIYLETPWSFIDREQTNFRAVTFDMDKKVYIDHLILKDTLDGYVLKKQLAKQTVANKTITNKKEV